MNNQKINLSTPPTSPIPAQSASTEASALPFPPQKTECPISGASNTKPEGAPPGAPLETTTRPEGAPSGAILDKEIGKLSLQEPKKRNRSGAEKKRWKKARAAAAGSNRPALPPAPSTYNWRIAKATATGSEGPGLPPRPSTSGTASGTAGGTKRGHSDGSTPPSAQRVTKKSRAATMKPSTYSQAANSAMRVAIAEFNYPEVKLTGAQATLVQRGLDSIVEDLPLGDQQPMFLPRFDEFRWAELGVIYVTCADEPSKLWLKDNVANLQPWKEAKLKVLEGETLPKLKKLIAWVPGAPDPTEKIMRRLQLYNPGLQTKLWKVRDRHEELLSVRLVLGVDEASATILEAQGYKAYAGMTRVSFADPKTSRGTEGPLEEPLGPQEVASMEVSAEEEGGH